VSVDTLESYGQPTPCQKRTTGGTWPNATRCTQIWQNVNECDQTWPKVTKRDQTLSIVVSQKCCLPNCLFGAGLLLAVFVIGCCCKGECFVGWYRYSFVQFYEVSLNRFYDDSFVRCLISVQSKRFINFSNALWPRTRDNVRDLPVFSRPQNRNL
jgi:hypothetical protein